MKEQNILKLNALLKLVRYMYVDYTCELIDGALKRK